MILHKPEYLTVVIMGAKPDFKEVKGDYLYLANAAMPTSQKFFTSFKSSTIVCGEGWLADDPGRSDSEYFTKKRIILNNLRFVDKLVLRQTFLEFQTRSVENTYSYSKVLEKIFSVSELMQDVINFREPLLRVIFDCGYSDSRRIVRSLVGVTLRRILKKNLKLDWPAEMRISMGITALLYAISIHRYDATYVLTGVGLSNRHSYSFGEAANLAADSIGHTLADVIVLKELNRKYNLMTDNNEISSKTGIPLL